MLNRLRTVFESLRSREVHYLVVGGIAAVLHGVPRAAFDPDLLIEALPRTPGGCSTPSSTRRSGLR